MNNIIYKNIFLYSSLQFTGNIEEYFVMHTEKLVVFIVMPRQQHNKCLIRLYKRGKLIEEKKVVLSKNIFIYYLLLYFKYLSFLFHYFSRNEKIVVVSLHPIFFFGMRIQKMIRNIDFLYWDPDYFPPVNIYLKLFEKLKKYYNKKIKYVMYLSDTINKKMNGKTMSTPFKKTVMWGVLPKKIKRQYSKTRFTILFVGVIKESQGLELLFDFLKRNKDCFANIIGVCTGNLYDQYMKVIKENKIDHQIYFPNKFFSDTELERLSQKSQCGIALYDIDKNSATYYTDPGKVKTYASLGLPVIMSDTSAVAPYVKKFNSGILIRDINDLGRAVTDMKKNYKKYSSGIEKFNQYFYFDSYYKKAFSFLESL